MKKSKHTQKHTINRPTYKYFVPFAQPKNIYTTCIESLAKFFSFFVYNQMDFLNGKNQRICLNIIYKLEYKIYLMYSMFFIDIC